MVGSKDFCGTLVFQSLWRQLILPNFSVIVKMPIKMDLFVMQRQKGHPRKSDKESNAFEDYIKQQKSYFAEIDAFELSEEEVAPGDESD